jgi:hypothetical protein
LKKVLGRGIKKQQFLRHSGARTCASYDAQLRIWESITPAPAMPYYVYLLASKKHGTLYLASFCRETPGFMFRRVISSIKLG